MRLTLLLSLALSTQALAKSKKAPKPISVQIQNSCKGEIRLGLENREFKVAPGTTSALESLQGKADWAFKLRLDGADAGLLSLEPGTKYGIQVKECQAGGANFYTQSYKERPKNISPQAAAQLRFRAQQNLHLEYRAGKRGRFKPLSVAMTSYRDVPGGELEFTFRLRAARRGPVLKVFKKSIKLESGHRYLVEARVNNQEIFFKQEDEGWPSKKR